MSGRSQGRSAARAVVDERRRQKRPADARMVDLIEEQLAQRGTG